MKSRALVIVISIVIFIAQTAYSIEILKRDDGGKDSPYLLKVGPHGDYKTITSAINAVTGAGSGTPYTIVVASGVYNETLTLKSDVHIAGIDKDTCIVVGSGTVCVPAVRSSVKNLTFKNNGQGKSYAVDPGATQMHTFEMRDCYIEALNACGVRLNSGGGSGPAYAWTMYLRNTKIKTGKTAVEIEGGGQYTFYNCDFHLTGQGLNWDHVGIMVLGAARVKMQGGSVYSTWDTSGEHITGVADNVYAVYIPSTNSNYPRIHLYNVDTMIRNEDNAEVVTIKADGTGSSGYVRIFSGIMQAEKGTGTSNIIKTTGVNKIELYDPMFRGPTWGNDISGTVTGKYIRDGVEHYRYGINERDGNTVRRYMDTGVATSIGGKVTLLAGSSTVSTSRVTANSMIFLTAQTSSVNAGDLSVSARSAGVSFTISSSNALDNRQVAWQMIEAY